MASSDLRSFFKIIESASSGEAVRDAIIDAAKALKTSAANAGSIDGIPASEFAIRTEYERQMEAVWKKIAFDAAEALEDNEYALASENVMTSGNLYTVIGTYLRPAFSTIMHYEVDPKTDMETLKACDSYLTTLTNTKKKMIDALKAKKKLATMIFDFREIAEIINHIADDIPELEEGNFDKNKTYDAGENYTYYRAYSSIKVDVPDSELKVEGNFDDNHVTHYPPEGKLFSSVSINLPNASSAKSSSTSGRTGGSTTKPTQSGASTDPDNEEEIKKVDENGLLENKEIDANGTYVASETDACEGYKMVSVHVKEPKVTGTFKVTFYNGNDPLEEQEVSAYSTAQYSGSKPVNHEDAALEFKGWSPVPVRVTSDMDVYAQFGEPEPATIGEIEDSWDDIVACAGTKYSVGQYKSLTIGEVSGKQYGTLIMEKVGTGHSNSLWCSKTLFRNTVIGGMASWPKSNIRSFLNGEFLEVLSTLSDGTTIVNALVPTTIYTTAPWCDWEDTQISGSYETRCEMQTIDEIWVPSFYEMFGVSLVETYKTLIHHHLNERNQPGSMEYGSMATNSWSEPFIPNYRGYEQHEKILDMSGAYGGVQVSTDQEQRNVVLTPNTPDRYKKVSSTNTSQYLGYKLRTIDSYGYPNGGGNNIHMYWGVSDSGIPTENGGDQYPICFAF